MDGYWGVLLGWEEPPHFNGILTLMEYAEAVYARGMHISAQILRMERKGEVLKNSTLYKFRTGELRTFCEVARHKADLGSRRVTAARLEFDMEREAV